MADAIKSEIDLLLETRDQTHGKYEKTAKAAQAIKKAMHSEDGWYSLEEDQKEALDMIASKIGRILGGNPDFKDHYDDIAGYAQLVAKRLAKC